METNKILYIIRGLPGSGKSTKGEELTPGYSYSADDYFYILGKGKYTFDPSKLGDAHGLCQRRVEKAMQEGVPAISVCNTFTQAWEVKPYRLMATRYNYTVKVIHMQGDWGSLHNVPAHAIQNMRQRWEDAV